MFEGIRSLVARHKNKALILLAALAVLDALIFAQIGASRSGYKPFAISFLNVGQGDASLLIFPTGVKMLIDGGPPNGRVLAELEEILPHTDRYLDLVMMSHPQVDHFGGLIEVVRRYSVGAFLMSVRNGEGEALTELQKVIAERGIRTVTLGRGDAVRNGATVASVLSPTPALLMSKEANDASMVVEVLSAGVTSLFTGDMGSKAEAALLPLLPGRIDILKVPHHGSKFASGAAFLKAVHPVLAVIEVGKNSYGHPTPEVLARLAEVGAKIFRTDEGGVTVTADGESLRIFR
ncbi:MAG: MBL fold metallo-hydrolase [Candidatus Jorgensenbacteria bacterium]